MLFRSGYVLSDKDGNTFYTDLRYFEAATNSLKGTDIAVKEFVPPFENLLNGYKEVAIPLGRTLYNDYNKLKASGLEVKDSLPYFTSAMSVKDELEIENIEMACKIADKAYASLLGQIKEGMTENDVAALLEYLMRGFGASGTSFDTIVAFGANSSVPHHETGFDKLKFGDIVLIDFGCKVNGYCSDITRTFLFGDDKKHGDFKKAYAEVYAAHELVKEKLTAGMTGREADEIARGYLRKAGLDRYFTHSLGHGIGLNIHEKPNLSPRSEGKLLNGMVFSDEPGVYLAGEFGIRIEDSVMLKDGKVVSFMNKTERNLVIL